MITLPVTTRCSWRFYRICGNPYQQAIAKSQEEELAEWLASDGWILRESSSWCKVELINGDFGMNIHIGSQKQGTRVLTHNQINIDDL